MLQSCVPAPTRHDTLADLCPRRLVRSREGGKGRKAGLWGQPGSEPGLVCASSDVVCAAASVRALDPGVLSWRQAHPDTLSWQRRGMLVGVWAPGPMQSGAQCRVSALLCSALFCSALLIFVLCAKTRPRWMSRPVRLCYGVTLMRHGGRTCLRRQSGGRCVRCASRGERGGEGAKGQPSSSDGRRYRCCYDCCNAM